MKQISLAQFFKELTEAILNKKEQDVYYYKRKNFYTEQDEYSQITEVDLMYGRFRTIDGDFSEFEWEIEKSSIYKE